MNLTRSDVERIVENMLENIKVSVSRGGFTDPNSRKVTLSYNSKVISETWFDVVQTREYEG